jgi:hypothetical protein
LTTKLLLCIIIIERIRKGSKGDPNEKSDEEVYHSVGSTLSSFLDDVRRDIC